MKEYKQLYIEEGNGPCRRVIDSSGLLMIILYYLSVVLLLSAEANKDGYSDEFFIHISVYAAIACLVLAVISNVVFSISQQFKKSRSELERVKSFCNYLHTMDLLNLSDVEYLLAAVEEPSDTKADKARKSLSTILVSVVSTALVTTITIILSGTTTVKLPQGVISIICGVVMLLLGYPVLTIFIPLISNTADDTEFVEKAFRTDLLFIKSCLRKRMNAEEMKTFAARFGTSAEENKTENIR